jgi:PhoPQ-activated pathogenicity-related protein
MVKSVVRAMDVVQLLSKKEKKAAVNGFVVAGHSKRGHTTWLVAAADKRVKGIIPIAIDILNSNAQLPHQLEAFGEYNTPSKAATDFLQELKQPRGQSLIKMVDAYSYREQLTLPKLIVSATNDDFFTTDALNLYWDGLKKPKWVLYLSNANHVRADADPRINPTAFAFVRMVAAHKSLPELDWQYIRNENKIVLKVTADAAATKALLWTSQSENKDFRQALWISQPMTLKSKEGNTNDGSESAKEYSIEVPVPPIGYMAIFGEVEFIQSGHTFLLSTQTNISSINK